MRPFAAVAVLLVLAGCGGDDDDASAPETTSEATTTSSTTSTSSTTTTTEPATTSTTEDLTGEGIGAVEAVLPELLIREGELGDPTLVDTGYTPPVGSGPCGVEIDAQVPPASLVGAAFESGPNQLRVLQELRAYDNVDDAVAAVAALHAGPACAGSIDVVAEVGGDEAFFVETPESARVEIVARVADVVLSFDITGTIDQREVAAFGIGKVLAFIEAAAAPPG